MAKLRKPSMEVYLFGDRDVIATSWPDYHYPPNPSGEAESPELPVGSMMTTMQGRRSAASSQDLFDMMQTMMLANGPDQNQDMTLRSN